MPNTDCQKNSTDLASQPNSMSSYFEIKGLYVPGSFRTKHAFESFLRLLSFPGHEIEFHFVRDPAQPQDELTPQIPFYEGERQGIIEACIAGMTTQRNTALNMSVAEYCVFEVKTTVDPQKLVLEATHEQLVDEITRHFPGDHQLLFWKMSKNEFEARKGPAGIQIKGIKKGGSHSVGFSELFANVYHTVSWRMSLTLKTGYKSAQQALYKKTRLARCVDFLFGTRLLDKHHEDMIEFSQNFGDLAQCKMTFHAWGEDARQESENVRMLDSVLRGMGVCDLSDGCVVSSEQAFNYLPISRPGSLWRTGSVLFRAKDGKVIPYTPYSMNQRAHTELVYDARGQSLESYHSTMNQALIAVLPGLPRIGRITIGGKSDPFVEVLCADLVDTEKYLVLQKTLTPAIEDAVNIFGTSYGIQRAAEFEVRGIVSFLIMLCSDQFGRTGGDDSIYDLFRMGISEVYHRYSEGVCPKAYVKGACQSVDNALSNLKEAAPLSWWGVVTLLHEHQLYEVAMQAQHHAVPVLADFVHILQDSPMIQDEFYQVRDWNTGEPIVAVVRRKILAAIAAWPALSQPTMFDIGASRIVTISVSSAGTKPACEKDWAEAVLYLLARSALISRDFNMRQRFSTHLIPEAFQEYHQRVADEEERLGRKLCFSQYQKVAQFPPVVGCLTGDLRNSRMTGSAVTLDMNDVRGIDNRFLQMFTTVATLAPESLNPDEKLKADALSETLDCDGFSAHKRGINLLFSARTRSDTHHLMEHKLFLQFFGRM